MNEEQAKAALQKRIVPMTPERRERLLKGIDARIDQLEAQDASLARWGPVGVVLVLAAVAVTVWMSLSGGDRPEPPKAPQPVQEPAPQVVPHSPAERPL